MADPTKTEAPRIEPAPSTKVTRARATTSRPPKAAARLKPARPVGEPVKATSGSTAPSATPSRAEPFARPANVQINQGGADSVSADAVHVTQGGITTVNAQKVEVRQGGIVNAQADEITVRMGGIALARADRVSVEMGGLGFAFAREAHLSQGAARSLIAQDVRIDQGLVGTALAGRVTFERPSGVLVLIAGRVEGPVKTLLDWRGALAFGAAFGLLVGLVRRR